MTLENHRFAYFISSIGHACLAHGVYAQPEMFLVFYRPGGRRITLLMCFEQMVELFWPLLWKWIAPISTATTPTLIKKLITRN